MHGQCLQCLHGIYSSRSSPNPLLLAKHDAITIHYDISTSNHNQWKMSIAETTGHPCNWLIWAISSNRDAQGPSLGGHPPVKGVTWRVWLGLGVTEIILMFCGCQKQAVEDRAFNKIPDRTDQQKASGLHASGHVIPKSQETIEHLNDISQKLQPKENVIIADSNKKRKKEKQVQYRIQYWVTEQECQSGYLDGGLCLSASGNSNLLGNSCTVLE